jgi:hypothetical protein
MKYIRTYANNVANIVDVFTYIYSSILEVRSNYFLQGRKEEVQMKEICMNESFLKQYIC